MNEVESVEVRDNKTKKEAISRIVGYLNYWRKEGKVVNVELSYSG